MYVYGWERKTQASGNVHTPEHLFFPLLEKQQNGLLHNDQELKPSSQWEHVKMLAWVNFARVSWTVSWTFSPSPGKNRGNYVYEALRFEVWL